MSIRTGVSPAEGRTTALRLVGAATGSLVATVLALALFMVDAFLAAASLFGAPLGAALGFVGAPFLVAGTPQQATLRASFVAFVAVLCGLVVLAAYDAIRHGWDWFPTAVFVYSGAVAVLALPPALLVAITATHLLRGLGPARRSGVEGWADRHRRQRGRLRIDAALRARSAADRRLITRLGIDNPAH
ncbi:MAG: hypothetical protein LC798_08550 [Chloroflexi bacterium]|nr:hypothetical protein [Chloroflexota bacterium]